MEVSSCSGHLYTICSTSQIGRLTVLMLPFNFSRSLTVIEENVVVQIKYPHIDFQIREPTSPLFANLHHTGIAIEFQVAQEYPGQQCHLVYLPPLWKTVLDFDLRVDNKTLMARGIISGQRFNQSLGGSAAVVSVGN